MFLAEELFNPKDLGDLTLVGLAWILAYTLARIVLFLVVDRRKSTEESNKVDVEQTVLGQKLAELATKAISETELTRLAYEGSAGIMRQISQTIVVLSDSINKLNADITSRLSVILATTSSLQTDIQTSMKDMQAVLEAANLTQQGALKAQFDELRKTSEPAEFEVKFVDNCDHVLSTAKVVPQVNEQGQIVSFVVSYHEIKDEVPA